MNGTALNSETNLSQILNQSLFSKIPLGLVTTKMIPKINPKIPPKIAGHKVI